MTYLVSIVILLELSFDFPSLRMTHYIQGFTFSISSSILWVVYFLSIMVNSLLLYWLWIERNDKTFQNNIKSFRVSNLREILNHEMSTTTQNLIDKFGNVFDDKNDIYYFKNYLILKTGNIIDNGIKRYSGLYLEMNYYKYFFFVKLKIIIPTLLDRQNFTNITLISGLVIMTIISIFKFLQINILG